MLLITMKNLKPIIISHKEFNELIKGKGFKGRSEYKLKDLKAKFGFKPMYDRCTLTISSEDMDLPHLTLWGKLLKLPAYHTVFLYMQRTRKEISLKKIKKFII